MAKTVKIISWNLNGIRSAFQKGLADFMKREKADFFCFQETKAQPDQFPTGLKSAFSFSCLNSATKKGYSGVALFSDGHPRFAKTTIGFDRFDKEGRLIEIELPDFFLLNVYLPHGGRDKVNLPYKLLVFKRLKEHLATLKEKPVVVVGDFNVAQQEIDLARPKQNKNNIMFTPKERGAMEKILNLGLIDSFRMFNKEGGHYTWWPYFHQARQRNLGWRIDYCLVSESIRHRIKNAFILPQVFGSDHCPVGIEVE